MSRSFFGGGALGGGKKSGKKGNSMNPFAKRGGAAGADKNLTPDERYKAAVEGKMKRMRDEAMQAKLAGADGKLSKTAEAMIEMLAQKQAKKEAKAAKKKSAATEIKARYLGGMTGGRIDKNGKIYASNGLQVGYIKKGVMKGMNGVGFGKYAGNMFSDDKIAAHIRKSTQKQQTASTAGFWGGGGASAGGGSVWGNNDDSGGTGGFWG